MLIENQLINTIEKNGGAYHFALAKNLYSINKLYKIDNESILNKITNVLQLLQQYKQLTRENLNNLSELSSLTDVLLLRSSSDYNEIDDKQVKHITTWLSELVVNVFKDDKNLSNVGVSDIIVLQGKNVDANVIDRSLRVYKLYFGESDLGPSEEYNALHEHNPDMYYYALDTLTNEVVGNLEAIPFDESYLKEYENGLHDNEFLDGSYPIDRIPQYRIPGIYSIVLELIAVDPQYKGYRAVLRKLLSTFIEKLLSLANDDIFIRDIFTDIYTDEGEKLANHFGFKKIRKSIDGHLYKICLFPPDIMSLFPENVKKLQEVYNQRFIQYQKLVEHPTYEVADSEQHDNNKLENWKYSVGLSFSGNERAYVDRVAKELKRLEVNIFYDDFEQVELWGKDLYQHLNTIYKKECQFCIVFVSKSYAEKLWTRHEIKSAQTRAFEDENEYLLPVRMDDTEIPGINSTIGYIDARKLTPEQLARLTFEKIKK